MKVAIYLDDPKYEGIANKAISAARIAMPEAEIWHLTTLSGPTLTADQELRVDVAGGFCARRPKISAMLSGEVLFIDADIVVREDVSEVFNHDFDVCVTTDEKPGSREIKYNGGVIFSRCPGFFKVLAQSMECEWTFRDWLKSETTFTRIVDSDRFRVMVLPGSQYNKIPNGQEDTIGKIIHYRGSRKKWMGIPAK